MDETYTFRSEDGIFEVTIKAEFLKTVPNPTEYAFKDLMTQHNLAQYFHNPIGPAIRILKNGYEDYWLDGKQVSPEVAEKIKHGVKFNTTMDDILND